MDRQYVKLRPAATAPNHGPDFAGMFEPAEVTKRRTNVPVACNTCRKKRVRCDGLRPTCSNCLGESASCSYRDDAEADLLPQSKKLVVEIIQILSNVSGPHAIKLLSSLKSEKNAAVILSILRHEVESTDAVSTVPPVFAGASSPFEFELQNRTAYPKPPPEENKRHFGDFDSFSRSTLDADKVLMEPNIKPTSPETLLREKRRSVNYDTEAPVTELCDARLQQLNIKIWTSVQIDNEMAARCFSLYLETDHPLLGPFDPELFISHLVSGVVGDGAYCTPLLVNALLYWACQMYGYINPAAEERALDFCTEAERLLETERIQGRDSITTIAAIEFICLGYLGQGRDDAILQYISEASQMGIRMGLFGVVDGTTSEVCEEAAPVDEPSSARSYTAWGVFNWITLMSLFYRQPGLFCPRYPPELTIPDLEVSTAPAYMGSTFPHICRFWRIVHEVSLVYQTDGQQYWGSGGSLSFAEYKFRELLAWSNTLPPQLVPAQRNPHHVQVLHLWFHAIILDIFRPFTQTALQKCQLRTFSGKPATADDVCSASVQQLKTLIIEYRERYQASKYTLLWQTALVYVINAVLHSTTDTDLYTDLLLCIYAYKSLSRSWRVASCISKGLLSLALQKSYLSSQSAVKILHDLRRGALDGISGEPRALFMADLDLALYDPHSASMEHLAMQFENNALMKDYTTVFEEDMRN